MVFNIFLYFGEQAFPLIVGDNAISLKNYALFV